MLGEDWQAHRRFPSPTYLPWLEGPETLLLVDLLLQSPPKSLSSLQLESVNCAKYMHIIKFTILT